MWMDLENILLGEMPNRKGQEPHNLTHMRLINQEATHEQPKQPSKQTHRCRQQMITQGEQG